MGKKTHRGKAGGRRRFLWALRRELNSVRDFDPSAYWAELPPIQPPSEEPPATETHSKLNVSPPRDILKEIIQFRGRAAKFAQVYIPIRISMRPGPVAAHARKPTATRKTPRVIKSIKVNFLVRKTTYGFIISN